MLKEFNFIGDAEDACICKKLSGSAETNFQYIMQSTYYWLEMMYLLLTQVKNFIKIGFQWKTWAKPEYLASMSIWIDWGANMVLQNVHR